MRKNKHEVLNLGQKLLTLQATVEVISPNGTKKSKNVWENHGFFASRQFAQKFAKERRPGRKVHIEGGRIEITPMEFKRREEGSKGFDTLVAKAE